MLVFETVSVFEGGQMGSGQMLWIIKHRWRTDRRLTCLQPVLHPSMSLSLTSLCLWLSSNIYTSSVIMSSHIPQLPCDFLLYSLCIQPTSLSLSASPHPLPILVVNVDIGWTITITKDELEGENAAFFNSTVYNFAIKRCHLNIFTPDFKQPLCFTGTQGAASSPVASPGLMA